VATGSASPRTSIIHDIQGDGSQPGKFAVRQGDWKLVQEGGATTPLLFNLRKDPGETRDLSAEHPNMVKTLSALVAKANATAVPYVDPQPEADSDPRRHGGAWVPWNGE